MRKLFLPAICAAALSLGQSPKFDLSIDNIMRGPAIYGYEPSAVRWSGSSELIYFQWKQAAESHRKTPDTYVVSRNGSGLRKLTEAESKLAPPVQADRSPDKLRAVYAQDGDIYLYDYTSDKARRLTRTSDPESNPRFLRDGKRIAFTRSGNLYVMSLDSPLLEQLTDIRPAPVPGAPAAAPAASPVVVEGEGQGRNANTCPPESEKKLPANQEFMKREDRTLLEIVRERQQKCDEDIARRKRENPRKPFTLAARQAVTSLVLSPDEQSVIVTVSEPAEGAKTTIVPNFVSLSAYTEDIGSRSKVGDPSSRIRMAIVSTASGEWKWFEHSIKDKQISLTGLQWSEDGARAFVQGRSQDNKDRWLFAVDTAGAKLTTLATMHDDAWVNFSGQQSTGWMKGDREIYFVSEKDGYAHLYAVAVQGGEPRQLTSGKFEVLGVQLSRDRSRFFLTTNEGGPEEKHLYEMNATGGQRRRITSMPGFHAGVVSPDEKHVADIYSFSNKPPELYVQPIAPQAAATRLTTSPAGEFANYRWSDVPIVHIPARDGAQVPRTCTNPANYRAGGPAVIFVHGAGYLQNVHRGWSSNYAREYLFHHFLMEHGYLVIDIDYRGSAGYGRDWRTGIYRHMGGKDLDDHVDAARWLVSQHGVDPKRIGLYGGSYGGFITLMAMFTQPDTFRAGAALRPVTDWAHYNHGYTSNILNAPQADAEAYRQSSPIYFASGLKGALLICHGMVDTNVHFQDTVRLTQKLIELHKENWELAVYPAEDHGFLEAASWADEYKRIFRLFETNLKK